MTITTIFVLLVAFQIKHFLCDYPLQGEYMLGKFKGYPEWILPLMAHACVQALGTFAIVFSYIVATGAVVAPPIAFGLVALDLVLHFVMDRVKVWVNKTFEAANAPSKPKFWWMLGADQTFHHLTHYAIIAALAAL